MSNKLRKFFRFLNIYGFRRTLAKSFGRIRSGISLRILFARAWLPKQKTVLLVGCGQFGFATIGYFLAKNKGFIVNSIYDPNSENMATFSNAYGRPEQLNFEELQEISSDKIRIAYIASNHASHTDYACKLLAKEIDVYIEKPISVTEEQLSRLSNAIDNSTSRVFVGYNRPHSAAIIETNRHLRSGLPITMNCFVAGHLIEKDHWYRDPREGTRVCGNLGHWLDLSIHLLMKVGVVGRLTITVTYSDTSTPDDNLTVSIVSEQGDLITLTLTAREEPFEGINESILIQQERLFVKIDDFRSAEFQLGEKKYTRKYFPKDVGHEKAILQPFQDRYSRDLREIMISTKLMLHITDMVRQQLTSSSFHMD